MPLIYPKISHSFTILTKYLHIINLVMSFVSKLSVFLGNGIHVCDTLCLSVEFYTFMASTYSLLKDYVSVYVLMDDWLTIHLYNSPQ